MQPRFSNTLRCALTKLRTRESKGIPPIFLNHATRTPLKLRSRLPAKREPGSEIEIGQRASGPAIALSRRAKSGTFRAMGPETAIVDQESPAAAWATRPGATRNPTMPQNAAGLRKEPPLSLPSAIGTMPHARLTAAPPLLPPQVFVRSCGFLVAPNTALKVCDPAPNSGALVLPRQMAPALRMRSTRMASCFGMLSLKIREP